MRAIGIPFVLALAIFAVIGQTGRTDTVKQARDGWKQPTAAGIAVTATYANRGAPFVLWGWSNAIDDQAADFWGIMTWSTDPAGNNLQVPPSMPNGPMFWGYTETGKISDLCALDQAYPQLTVVTRDPTLSEQLLNACPTTKAHIELSSPAH